MMYNFLDNTANREIITCNFNQHNKTLHPDRTLYEHDLIYIREGTWSIGQDGVEYEVGPGDVILLQGGHHHYGTKPSSSVVKTCFVHFTMDARDRIGDREETDGTQWMFPMVVNCSASPMVERYFRMLIFSYWSDDAYARKKAEAYLSLLLSEISEQNTAGSKHVSMVADMKRKIKTTPERFISAEEFAAQYYCSVRTVTSAFKKETGCSLHAWQIQEKCKMASALLCSEPSVTLKELASTFGFYDAFHFSKCYKKVMGVAPKK